MEQDFVILKVSWETHRIRNYDATEENKITYQYYKSLISFLQENNLTTRTILLPDEVVTDDLCIYKSDLTDDGFEIFKKKYFDKWIDNIFDKGKSAMDTSYLSKSLKKIRIPPKADL